MRFYKRWLPPINGLKKWNTNYFQVFEFVMKLKSVPTYYIINNKDDLNHSIKHLYLTPWTIAWRVNGFVDIYGPFAWAKAIYYVRNNDHSIKSLKPRSIQSMAGMPRQENHRALAFTAPCHFLWGVWSYSMNGNIFFFSLWELLKQEFWINSVSIQRYLLMNRNV